MSKTKNELRPIRLEITEDIEYSVAHKLGKYKTDRLFLESLSYEFERLRHLYHCRYQSVPARDIHEQLVDVSVASRALRDVLINIDPQIESIIRQGQLLRRLQFSPFTLSTELVGYLENIYLAIETVEKEWRIPAHRPEAWQEREVIELAVKCWKKAQGKMPGKTDGGPFHKLVNDILKQIGLTPRSIDTIKSVIGEFNHKG